MEARRILLMRHGEKPDNSSDVNLSPAGHERAQKLVHYIPATFGKPDFLFAAAISKESERPYQTLKPLSKATDVTIDTNYADKDYAALAHHILGKDHFTGKLVLVCWHHGEIPFFAHALGAKPLTYPDPWPETVFDLILQFDLMSGVPTVRHVTEPF